MVDVDIAGRRPGGTVVGALPRAAGGSACRADHDVGAVALQDRLTGVASAGHGVPVGEQVTVVRARVGPRTHSQSSKLRLGRGGSGDAGLGASVSIQRRARPVAEDGARVGLTGVGIGSGSATGSGTGAARPAPASMNKAAVTFMLAVDDAKNRRNRVRTGMKAERCRERVAWQ